MNRYITIKNPLRYQDIVTKQRLKISVLLTWAIVVCLLVEEVVLAAMASETDIYSIYLKVSGIIVSIYGVLCIVVISSVTATFSQKHADRKNVFRPKIYPKKKHKESRKTKKQPTPSQ